MFSYVVPFILDDYTVGVVGMDVDVNLIRESVSDISLYESGKAFIIQENGDVVYHEHHPDGCTFNELNEREQTNVKKLLESEYDEVIPYPIDENIDRRVVLKKLKNGMIMGIYVPFSEVNKPQNLLLKRYLLFMLIMLFIAITVCIVWIRTVIKPLKKLNDVVKEYKDGKFETEIDINSTDEVGVLADSFRQTAKSLNEYIGLVNNQAKTDSLTGLNNGSAYNAMEEAVNRQIAEGDIEFSVVVIDINDLKKVNDSLGHKAGDLYIRANARTIADALKSFGKVYRTGGDEFMFIGKNLEKCQEVLSGLQKQDKTDIQYGSFNLAFAFGLVEKNKDEDVHGAAERADKLMYINKVAIKGAGNVRNTI